MAKSIANSYSSRRLPAQSSQKGGDLFRSPFFIPALTSFHCFLCVLAQASFTSLVRLKLKQTETFKLQRQHTAHTAHSANTAHISHTIVYSCIKTEISGLAEKTRHALQSQKFGVPLVALFLIMSDRLASLSLFCPQQLKKAQDGCGEVNMLLQGRPTLSLSL